MNSSADAATRCPAIHFEVLARDPEALKRFYADVFGWEVADHPMEGFDFMFTARPDDTGPRGASMDIGAPPDDAYGDYGMIVYLEVTDLKATLERVERSGGRILTAPRRVTNGPLVSRVADLENNVLGLAERRSPDAPLDAASA